MDNIREIYANLHPLLRRAIQFLEQKDWGSADDYCERCLDVEPENAYAYVIKIMARAGVCREEDLGVAAISFEEWSCYRAAYQYADEALKDRLDRYIQDAKNNIKMIEEERKRAEEERRNSEIFNRALRLQNSSSIADVSAAVSWFSSIAGYKDASDRVEKCKQRITNLKEIRRIEREQEERDERRRKRRRAIIVSIILSVVLLLIICFVASNGKKAEQIRAALVGCSFEYTETEYITNDVMTVLLEGAKKTRTKYTFISENSVKIQTSYVVIDANEVFNEGNESWDNHDVEMVTWDNLTVPLIGKPSLEINGRKFTVNLDSQNCVTSLSIDSTTYQ